MDDFTRDVRQAMRALIRSPGFATIAILTIGLGIGANTAIFSVVNPVLLRPLPYPAADRLVYVWGELPNRDITQFPASPPDVKDYREQAQSFEAIEGVFTFPQPLTGDDGDPEQVQVGAVTPGLLAMLGARPVAGRLFNDDDAAPIAGGQAGQGGPPLATAVVLSDGLWRRRFGADARVIGRTVGIVDLWSAPRIDYVTSPRGNVFLRLIGRLRPGVSVQQAQHEMDAVAAGISAGFPRYASAGFRVRLVPIRVDITAKIRSTVLTLLGAVAFVLLVACANVSNLLLVRATTKEGEWAVRAARGAGRSRLIRQSLVESGMIALAGACVGIGIAAAGIRLLLFRQPGDLPRLDEVRLDATVLGYAAVAAALAAGLFAAIPALRASRVDLARSLRDRGRSAQSRSHHLARSTIVVLEVALSLVLLVGAGLMVRSFSSLRDIDPGFDPQDAISFTVSLPGNRYPTSASRSAFWLQMQDRLSGMAGIRAVSAGWPLPLSGQIDAGRPYHDEEDLALRRPRARTHVARPPRPQSRHARPRQRRASPDFALEQRLDRASRRRSAEPPHRQHDDLLELADVIAFHTLFHDVTAGPGSPTGGRSGPVHDSRLPDSLASRYHAEWADVAVPGVAAGLGNGAVKSPSQTS